MLLLYLSVMGTFYFHDKNVLTACAYETITTGMIMERESEQEEELMIQLFQDRMKGKCIVFVHPRVNIVKNKAGAKIEVKEKKKKMIIDICLSGCKREPEEYLRKIHKYKNRSM